MSRESMSIPRGNRTCITHGERRLISCLDAFGPRPCKYKCKRHHPCDAGKLPQSLKRRPSKPWKRGVLQPLDAVVAAVAQETSPLDAVVAAVDTEDDSDAELALQIEKILADPVGSSGEQLHASASSGEQFRWPYPGTPGAEDTTPYGEQQCPTTMMQPAGSQDKRPRCGTCSNVMRETYLCDACWHTLCHECALRCPGCGNAYCPGCDATHRCAIPWWISWMQTHQTRLLLVYDYGAQANPSGALGASSMETCVGRQVADLELQAHLKNETERHDALFVNRQTRENIALEQSSIARQSIRQRLMSQAETTDSPAVLLPHGPDADAVVAAVAESEVCAMTPPRRGSRVGNGS